MIWCRCQKWNFMLKGSLALPAHCVLLVKKIFFKKSCFMFEELLVSLQPAVYFVSHRAVVASPNDRSPDRSPTTQMNRGALTAGGLFLRWDLKLLFSLSPLWWEITLELVRLLLFNSLFPVQIIPLFPQGQYEQSEKTCNNDIFSLQPCCVLCKSQNKQQLRSSVVMFSYHHWVSLLNHCRVIYLFIYLGNLEKKKKCHLKRITYNNHLWCGEE